MGCFWGWRDNNSYADTTITASDGTSYKYGTVFTEKTTKGEGIACSSYANCYIGCSCNTSNGWYSTCQGSDCKSATDNHYTGVNSLSAGKSISDIDSISASEAKSGLTTAAASSTAAKSGLTTASASGANSEISASANKYSSSATAGANSSISTMASGATTCYKVKTCSEGGYYTSSQSGMHCSAVGYNGYTCYDCHTPDFYYPSGYSYSYSSCKNGQSSHTPTCGHSGCSITGTTKYTAGTSKTCSDGGYYSSQPSCRKGCSTTSYCGNSCYASTCGSPKTCSDEGYESSIPSGKTCTKFTTSCGNTCYKDCESMHYHDYKCPSSYPWQRCNNSQLYKATSTDGGSCSCGEKINCYQCYTCADGGYKGNKSECSDETSAKTVSYKGMTCYECKDESVEVDYYTESRQEYSSAIGQNDNNLYLVIKSDRPADKNYTVVHDGYARYNGGYIPGSYADSHDGACEGSMMNSHSCTLKQGETKVECLLYECPCQNLWWDGTLSPSW